MASLSWSVMMLLLVVALIPVSLWVLKRLQGLQPTRGPRAIELLAQLPLGPRERVTAVRVGQRVLVLGVTAQQVNLLAELEGGVDELPAPDAQSPDFGAMLRQFSGRKQP